MLEIKNVSYFYTPGEYAVQELSLIVAPGEFVAVAGRNGSGKTTLTRLIMAILKPVSGQILLEGHNTAKFSTAAVARKIGYVFQNPDRQIFRDTVSEEVAYGPQQLGFSPLKTKAAVNEALEVTGLAELAGAYPRALSKGQKQRVAIASALAMRPQLLMLDEPTSGQDAGEKGRLMNLLSELNSHGMAIMLITHDMELLARYCKRAIVLDDGVKVFDGSPMALFADDKDVRCWGLRFPAAAQLAHELRRTGLPTADLPKALSPEKYLRREINHA